jgi:putative FmdB family regulatory protein
MPTYAYTCAADHTLELRARMGEAPPSVPCPRCGAEAPRTYLPIHTKRPSRTLDADDALTRFQHEHLG